MKKLNIPKKLEQTVLDFMTDEFRDCPSFYENYGRCCDTQPEPIEHRSYDGYIPYTNGGFQMLLMSDIYTSIGSGSFPESLRVELDRVQEQCEQDYRSDNDIAEEVGIDYGSDTDFHEYEQSYLTEQSEFWYTLRVSYHTSDNDRLPEHKGKDKLHIMAGVNTDYGYGRDCGLNVTFDEVIPVQGLTATHLLRLLNKAKGSI